MRWIVFFAQLVLAAICFERVHALNMNVTTYDAEKKAFANLWGKIDSGDDQKFRQLITPYLQKGYILYKVNVFSVGGNVQAAMGIGDQIRTLQTRTIAPTRFSRIVNNQQVENGYPSCWFTGDYDIYKPVDSAPWCDCASACFLIWASGITREGNHVGVHRIAFVDEGATKFGQMPGPEARRMYLAEQSRFQEYIKRLEVPAIIADRLWATDSRSMHYLTRPELELMQSTPYLEEQTLARCGPDKTIHMSASNNWTMTQDVKHVDCYRGLLLEFMRAGTKEYLGQGAAVVAEIPDKPIRAAPPTNSRWSYNGSSFRLLQTGSHRKVIYTDVRDGLREIGVTPGTVFFEGEQNGNAVNGTAFIFSKVCGPVGYSVRGTVEGDRIAMGGRLPVRNRQCVPVEYKESFIDLQRVE